MKKLIVLLLAFVPVYFIWANPVASSSPQINELLWDENGKWYLEIDFLHFYSGEVDSLVLTSTQGRYVLTGDLPEYGFRLLTADSTGSGFDINQGGDLLLLKVYPEELYFEPDSSYLAFGSHENAMDLWLVLGQSIALLPTINPCYAIDNSPTFGLNNDFEGACGTISGKIYYATGNPVISRSDLAFDEQFSTDGQGDYSTRIHQGMVQLSEIGKYYMWEGYGWYSIEPVSLTIEEGQVYENMDIHITDPGFVGIEDEKIEQPLKLFPNPISQKLTIEMTAKLESQELEILVLDISGKEVARYTKTAAETIELELNEPFPAGMYFFEFRLNNTLIQTERVLINLFK